MTDSFSQRFGGYNPFEKDRDDGTYKPWVLCQQSDVMNFKLVPAAHTGDPTTHVPYLQPITIEYHPMTGQLCLQCHGTGMLIFIEGRKLEELGDLIGGKQIKSIRMFDQSKYPPPENDKPVVTNIRIEKTI